MYLEGVWSRATYRHVATNILLFFSLCVTFLLFNYVPRPFFHPHSDTIFNMKFTAKTLGRLATKSNASIVTEKRRLKTALEKGNTDGARIYAENAIRAHHTSLNYLRLQSRLEAVSSKLEGHQQMAAVTADMTGVTASLGAALSSMDVNAIARTMDTFEKQFEDVDLSAKFVEGSIGESTALSTPAAEVDGLLEQVAAEHGLKVADELSQPMVPRYGVGSASGVSEASGSAAGADLEARFAALAGGGRPGGM